MTHVVLWHTLFDILMLLLAALVLGIACERLRQSPLLGYLSAGTLLGPNALGLISNQYQVQALAELGVALLLFTIGLEFSWQRLRRLGGAALGGGTVQVLATTVLGAAVTALLGIPFRGALAMGAVMAPSSTATVLRMLVSRAQVDSVHGRHALGILLMQDVAVVPLVLLVAVLAGQGSWFQIGTEIFKTFVWAGVLVGLFYLLFTVVAPRVLRLESLYRNRELPILLAIVTGLGSAWGSHKLGMSPALGAFVAGVLLAESPFATQIRSDIGSVRTLLVTLFFSSIGMLGDPVWFVGHLHWVGALVVAIVVGKALIIWMVLRLFRLTHTSALAAGLCLGQVGEFSFVLAEVGRGSVISEPVFKLVISATIATLFLTPYLVAIAPQVSAAVVNHLVRLGWMTVDSLTPPPDPSPVPNRVVIIGFGPAGQAVGQMLGERQIRVSVVDLNPRLIDIAHQYGFDGHIGDATHAAVLEHAGILSAAAAVVTIPDPTTARTVVEGVRSIDPEVYLIARGRYHHHLEELVAGGADEVIDEEQQVGARLAIRLRRRLRTLTRPSATP